MTKIFILIVWVHAGVLSDKDSMTMTSVPNFATLAECQAAGKAVAALTNSTVKSAKFICVEGVK